MPSSKGFQKYLPHVLIIALFIVISCLFCLPAFKGNIISQHDMYSWLYNSKEIRDYYEATGENPLWTNATFGGMPAITTHFYPKTNWYASILNSINNYSVDKPINPSFFFLFAMVSFYVLMLVLRVDKWVGAIGALAFAFTSNHPIIISAGHVTKMLDIAFFPGVIAGLLLAYRGRYWSGAALTGFFLVLFIQSGHYQIIYYGAMLVVLLVIGKLVQAIKHKDLKQWLVASCVLLLSAAVALTANSSRIIQTQEYTAYSTRGGTSELSTEKEKSKGLDRDYAFQWSNGIGETFCILVPNLYGGSASEDIGPDSHLGKKLASLNVQPQFIDQITSSAPLYWGPQPFTQPVYFGAVICLLTVLSLFVIKSKFKWWFVGGALLFIFISWGNHFSALNYFLFDHFPLMSKFRAPSMALAIPSVIFPLLGMWALRDIFMEKVPREELLKKVKLSVYITGGLCVLILLASVTTMEFKGKSDPQIEQQYSQAFNNPQIGKELVSSIRADRASAVQKDAFRSLVFILLAGGVLWGLSRGKVKKELAIAGLGLVIMIDEIPVANRYLNENNYLDEYAYEQQFQPRPVDVEIMKDPDPYYRVLDLTNTGGGEFNPFNSAKPSYFHKSIGGYHPAKMEIYKELIDVQLSKFNTAVLNMLNTKYLIVPGQNNNPVMQRNPEALGNAWFVSDVIWANTADDAMEALNAPSLQNPMDQAAGDFDPSRSVVLRDSLKSKLGNAAFGKDSLSSIRLVKYDPNVLTYESNNSQDGLAVFSEIYYPIGWKATVDGKEVPIHRANYVLRAIQVPAGKHVIEFSFHPPSFEKGESIGLVGSILLTLLILGGVYATYQKKRSSANAAEEGG